MITIVSFSWGKVVTRCRNQAPEIWKDCVITSDAVSEWNWRLDGTRHHPGITIRAYDMIKHNKVVILTTGVYDKLEITPELQEMIKDRPHTYILNSETAVKKYIELCQKGETSIGMLLHSTC